MNGLDIFSEEAHQHHTPQLNNTIRYKKMSSRTANDTSSQPQHATSFGFGAARPGTRGTKRESHKAIITQRQMPGLYLYACHAERAARVRCEQTTTTPPRTHSSKTHPQASKGWGLLPPNTHAGATRAPAPCMLMTVMGCDVVFSIAVSIAPQKLNAERVHRGALLPKQRPWLYCARTRARRLRASVRWS